MAFIVFDRPYKGKLSRVVPADKAQKIQQMLDNPPDDITDEQGEFLCAIKQIYHGKPSRPAEPDTSHLTHTGIEQGRMMQIPTGDR